MALDNFFVQELDPIAVRFKAKISNDKGESDEEFYATDLICEGPIEGLVDNGGNLLKYVYSENVSDIILAKGIFFNDVPALDTKLNKFNFTSIGFNISYGEESNSNSKEFPSTVFRYNQNIFLNDLEFQIGNLDNGFYCIGVDYDGSCTSMDIGGENLTFETNFVSAIESLGGNSYAVTQFEEAKLNCNPFTHKIKNKYCNYLKVQLKIDSLYSLDGGGTRRATLQFVVELSEDNSSRRFYCVSNLRLITKGSYLFEVPLKINLNSKSKNSYYVKIYPLTQKISPTTGNVVKSFSISSIVECIKEKGFFSYPYTAIVKSSVSSRHFSQDPNRTFDLKLLKIKVPNNYDSESKEYSGNWDGKFDSFLRWTDNPAWIFYDICTNPRYGIGNGNIIEKDLNKWELYKIAKYCDELVKTSNPHKYFEDTFVTDFTNSNYIYISKNQSSFGSVEARTLEDMKQMYPPVIDGGAYTQKNGGYQNSIIFLYDLQDDGGNYLEENYKKIIWKIEEGYRDDNQLFILTEEGEGSEFRITLVNDFGPRKAFEQDPTGSVLQAFSDAIKFDDSEIVDSASLSRAVQKSSVNTESGAKDFILNFYKSYLNNPVYSFFINSSIDKPVFSDYFNGKIISGKCKARILNYRDALENRFSINVLIDNETECLKLLNDLASVFRGLVYYKNNTITSTIDVNKPVSYFFNNTNVKDGMFSYSSGSIDGTYTVAKILYKDRFQNFIEEVEIVEDSELIRNYGIVMKEILGFGITSRSQARRAAEWLLMTNRFENESISFVTDLQGLVLKPGDIIKIEDIYKNDSTLQGRVLSVNYDEGYVVVDRSINLNLINQKIKFLCSKDKLQLNEITNSSQISDFDVDETVELRIERIENNSNRVYISTDYNFSLFNKIVSTSPFIIQDINASDSENLYKIVSIAEQDVNEYSVFCLKHDLDKYSKLDEGFFDKELKEKDKTISFSTYSSIEEIDLTGIPEEDSYFSVSKTSINNLSSSYFDYSFSEERSSLSIDQVDSYAVLNLDFEKIYNYISSQSTSDDYYKKIKDVFDEGGGFLCKVSMKNASIKFSVRASDISNKRIFLGSFPSSVSRVVSSVSGIRIYLFNKEDKFIRV